MGRRQPPQLPPGIRIYAIGDVHGCANLLEQAVSRIDTHMARNPVSRAIEVFLGDYVDRGPNSREVIDLLIERNRSREMVLLKGNHETYVSEFLKNDASLDKWRRYGGLDTLLSYRLSLPISPKPAERRELAERFAARLPGNHRQFLSDLKPSFTCGDFFFVHAGVRPGVPLDQQKEDDVLWIRDDFLLSEDNFEKFIVHGHTPVRDPDIRPNRINIDTGAFTTGRLTCLVIEGDEMRFIGDADQTATNFRRRERSQAVGDAQPQSSIEPQPYLQTAPPAAEATTAVQLTGPVTIPVRDNWRIPMRSALAAFVVATVGMLSVANLPSIWGTGTHVNSDVGASRGSGPIERPFVTDKPMGSAELKPVSEPKLVQSDLPAAGEGSPRTTRPPATATRTNVARVHHYTRRIQAHNLQRLSLIGIKPRASRVAANSFLQTASFRPRDCCLNAPRRRSPCRHARRHLCKSQNIWGPR
jgi:serine/threonine protein phosphatase 1